MIQVAVRVGGQPRLYHVPWEDTSPEGIKALAQVVAEDAQQWAGAAPRPILIGIPGGKQ